jgi:thiamine biosynthesis lipoprotein
MATVFEVVIAHEEAEFAGQAALAAFQEIDRLEQELSRYLPNSDVSRINNLSPFSETCISPDAFSCLLLSREYWLETKGAFDVAAGRLVDCWKARDRSMQAPSAGEIEEARRQSGMRLLTLDSERSVAGVLDPAPRIDAGAIGKGYAVDRAVELLKEWGVSAAIVHGGASSAFGYDDGDSTGGWPVTVSDPWRPDEIIRKINLNGIALSGSGVNRRTHIIDPRTGSPVPARRAAWACTETAAASDAISTACMVLGSGDIEAICGSRPGLQVVIIEKDPGDGAGRIISFGAGGSGAFA